MRAAILAVNPLKANTIQEAFGRSARIVSTEQSLSGEADDVIVIATDFLCSALNSIRTIKRARRDVPLAIYCEEAARDEVRRAIELGADDVITARRGVTLILITPRFESAGVARVV